MGRKSKVTEIETRLGQPIEKFIKEAIQNGQGPEQIKDTLGISLSATYEYINKLGLKAELKKANINPLLKKASGELSNMVTEYIKEKEVGQRSLGTIRAISSLLKKFLEWLADHKKPDILESFSAPFLREFISDFQKPNDNREKPLQPYTLYINYKIIKSFGNWLYKQEKIPRNPMSLIDPPKIPKRMPEDIPDTAIKAIFDSFGDDFAGVRNKAIITVFLDTGMRNGEVSNLKINVFDNEGKGHIIVKGNREQIKRISPTGMEIFRAYLEKRNAIAKNEWLWINENGSRFTRSSVEGMIRDLGKIVSGVRIHAHLFRHVFARYLVQKGVSVAAIARMGGWESLPLVMYYASAYSADDAFKEHDAASPITNILGKGK